MAFSKTIAPADAEGDLRAMYERQQSSWGFVPNYAKVFCHRPEVLARWARLLAELKRPMDARRFELITFAAAHELRHTACSLAHGKALTSFFEEDDVRKLALGEAGNAFTPAENAMMDFARKVAKDASRITSGDVDVLRSHGFSDEEIFDIAATAAGRAFFTKLLDSLGVEADASFLSMSKELRETLTVGRPIDFRQPEVMPFEEGLRKAQ
ncbi:MAG TPA: hypothetical protein VFZ51_08625 [Woeseiaceae bacterium]